MRYRKRFPLRRQIPRRVAAVVAVMPVWQKVDRANREE